jgi:predicted nucleic acid-binding protein
MKRVFFDTNIIIDVLTNRPLFFAASASALYKAECGEIIALMSATTWTTLFYIIRKHIGTERALKELSILRTYCEIAEVNSTIIDNAFHAVVIEKNFHDLEDAVQYYSALAVHSDYILTRNIKDFSRSTVPIVTPEEFLYHS